ncbi:MAG: hypothetical protein ACE5KX_02270 [Acidimicrobiia bacterium]
MRAPNPWIAVPVLIATAAGGLIGRNVVHVNCGRGGCLAAEIAAGVFGALVAFFGVGIVVVLAVRSLAEWRQAHGSDVEREPTASDDETPRR